MATNNAINNSVTNPSQPAFRSYLSASTSNDVTGDGTAYTIVWNTESFDQTASFNTGTGIFTAPIMGKYSFGCTVSLVNLGVAHTTGQIAIITTSLTQVLSFFNVGIVRSNTTVYVSNPVLLSMNQGDTALIQVTVAGSTKTVGIGGTNGASTFWGYLVC